MPPEVSIVRVKSFDTILDHKHIHEKFISFCFLKNKFLRQNSRLPTKNVSFDFNPTF